ncbi:MAG TPA: glycosyltransferase [Pyrinomonadaceae bacterium]|nr:glycosyltransferase [Pyrinomonadaceae bacterium]
MDRQSLPLVSVVMPVHNARPFLSASIISILSQTLSEFELIVLDDASTDGSGEFVRRWAQKDSRIRYFESEAQLGLSGSSNSVVEKARAPLVARMDADDISHPERLSRQWEILNEMPDVVAVGALSDGIDAQGKRIRPRDRWRIVRHSSHPPFPHGSVMFRRTVFAEIGGYREDAIDSEDQDLFLRLATRGKVVVLPDLLYHYRYHLNSASLVHSAGIVCDDLMARYSRAAMRLWAGHHPVRSSILAGDSFDWNLRTLAVLAWASWGDFSPVSLRFVLRSLIRGRDLLAGLRIKDGRPYEWRLEQ